jgi:hypothetical protein
LLQCACREPRLQHHLHDGRLCLHVGRVAERFCAIPIRFALQAVAATVGCASARTRHGAPEKRLLLISPVG